MLRFNSTDAFVGEQLAAVCLARKVRGRVAVTADGAAEIKGRRRDSVTGSLPSLSPVSV